MVSYLIDLVSFDNSMAASRRRDGSATQVERRSDPVTPAPGEVIDNNPNSDYNQKVRIRIICFKRRRTMDKDMNRDVIDSLEAFDRLYRKMDNIYHIYTRSCGFSDMALWLLYSLYKDGRVYTQRELCALWHSPPQTVNSALKSLERREIIRLEPVPGNKKSKAVVLTAQGNDAVQRVVVQLVRAEQAAFGKLTEEERKALLRVTEKYISGLQEELGRDKAVSRG